MKILLSAAAVAIGASFIPAPAQAQNCALRTDMVTALKFRHDESQVSAGLQNADVMVEVFASPNTGTFTILLTRTDGVSCIIAAGTNWAEVSALPVGVPG
ncbi:MAG: hypothetical protein AAFO93_07565 [Pseudomonadota bacterium]